jgi:hypothetical protein
VANNFGTHALNLGTGRVDGILRTHWLLFSGAYCVGRVLRPLRGPHHDPHWILFGFGQDGSPDPGAGWADSIDVVHGPSSIEARPAFKKPQL